MTQLRIGMIGCGNISPAYLKYLGQSRLVKVSALSDQAMEKARERASQFQIESVYTPEELLARNDIDLILNLTIPAAHADINLAALKHGKHVYCEKPLSISVEDAKAALDLAKEKGLRIGCAPDTFLGAGLETAKQIITEGKIGRPLAATAFMMGSGPESWHPNPEFFYAAGGGPMFDMGPYYLTALVQLLGPMIRISGSARSQMPNRIIQSGPRAGEIIPVFTPTHYSGTIDFISGAVATLVTSFDVPGGSTLPWIEIYGDEGTVLVPDPNRFDGEVKVRTKGSQEWEAVPHIFAGGPDERGRGIEDMAEAIRDNRVHQANGMLAFHVLEAMHAFARSSDEGRHIELSSAEDYVKLYKLHS